MSKVVANLDEAARARHDAKKERPEVIFKGEHFLLPPEPDADILDVLEDVAEASKAVGAKRDPKAPPDADAMRKAANAIRRMARLMLGNEYKRFNAKKPSLFDLMALCEAFPELYGFEDLGESQASPSS